VFSSGIVCHLNCRTDKTDLALPDWVKERVKGEGIRLLCESTRGRGMPRPHRISDPLDHAARTDDETHQRAVMFR